MKSIYEWTKNLACYYILLSAVMHFLPDNSYKKYISYYMGLLLILLLLFPVKGIFRLDEQIETYMEAFWEAEESQMEEWKIYGGEIEEKYEEVMEP